MWEYHHTDELYHHGIKGQQWGVRRFQNEDGSLTDEGKKRYAKYDKDFERTASEILEAKLNSENWPSVNDKRIRKAQEKGKQILDSMKEDGFASLDSTVDDYVAKYERKIANDCREYVKKKFGYDITDEEMYGEDEYLLGYLLGAL